MKNASTTHTVACRESVMFSVKDASRNVAKYWANEQAHGHTRCVFHDECGAELISTSGDVGHRTVHSSAGRLSRVRSTSAASGGEDGSACTSASGSGASAYASCGGAQGKASCRPRRRRPCLRRRIAAIFHEVWCEGEFCGGPSEELVSSMVCLDVCEDPCQLTRVDQRVTPCFGANGHAGTRVIAPWTSKVSVGLSALQAARNRGLNDLFAAASRSCRVSVWPRKCCKKSDVC